MKEITTLRVGALLPITNPVTDEYPGSSRLDSVVIGTQVNVTIERRDCPLRSVSWSCDTYEPVVVFKCYDRVTGLSSSLRFLVLR